jgi:hypothetical protein
MTLMGHLTHARTADDKEGVRFLLIAGVPLREPVRAGALIIGRRRRASYAEPWVCVRIRTRWRATALL